MNSIRTCIGCSAKRAPHEMLRVAASNGEAPVVDVAQKAAGRGAYLCRNKVCVERAFARRALERALKLKKQVPASMRVEIEQAIEVKRDE